MQQENEGSGRNITVCSRLIKAAANGAGGEAKLLE
jgi:hypothetical protein